MDRLSDYFIDPTGLTSLHLPEFSQTCQVPLMMPLVKASQ